jgi:hypothetical protein
MIDDDYYFRKQPAENKPDSGEAKSESSGSA